MSVPWRQEQLQRLGREGLTIAIDGPAGAGKSTVGRDLAAALGCTYIDTGLMYRAVTDQALRAGLDLAEGRLLAEVASQLTFAVARGVGLLINGQPASAALHRPAVDAAVSQVAAHPAVRQVLVTRQRELAAHGCIVMVGRDIGTVVLPEAAIKLWVTAGVETRARRRAEELSAMAETAVEQTLRGIVARDELDAGRATSPLRRAADAIVVETDHGTPAEVLERVLNLVAVRLLGPSPS